MSKEANARIEKKLFGTMPDGVEIYAYILTNSRFTMQVITYGATVSHLTIPDKDGNNSDVVLGFDSLEDYLNGSSYFGAIIGRYGNRIANGKFEIDGTTYQLVTNNDPNHLHGGNRGFDKVVWSLEETFVKGNTAGLILKYISPDGEEGYPGTLTTYVNYTLTEEGFDVSYKATTDKTTIINLTHHSYFNLSGHKQQDMLDHEVLINADHFLPVDSTSIPTGEIRKVEDTPFDFTFFKEVGRDINKDNEQLKRAGGYDHTWVLTGEGMKKAATVYHPESGRQLEIFTTEPGIQFYSGNWLNEHIKGKEGIIYDRHYGLALETQHYPDSPNKSDFPSVILNQGEVFTSLTSYHFSIR